MAYTPIGWLNDQAPAINQSNLNKMDNELVVLDAGETELNNHLLVTSEMTANGYYEYVLELFDGNIDNDGQEIPNVPGSIQYRRTDYLAASMFSYAHVVFNTSVRIYVYYYDSSKNFIRRGDIRSDETMSNQSSDGYIRIVVRPTYNAYFFLRSQTLLDIQESLETIPSELKSFIDLDANMAANGYEEYFLDLTLGDINNQGEEIPNTQGGIQYRRTGFLPASMFDYAKIIFNHSVRIYLHRYDENQVYIGNTNITGDENFDEVSQKYGYFRFVVRPTYDGHFYIRSAMLVNFTNKFPPDFVMQKASTNSDGTLKPSSSRAISQKIKYDRPMHIGLKNTFVNWDYFENPDVGISFFIITYEDDGTKIYETPWIRWDYEIPANVYFRICLKHGDNSSVDDFIANPSEYIALSENYTYLMMPEYYFDGNYIDGKVSAIDSAIRAGAVNGDVFILITDVHWDRNNHHSPALIKHITDRLLIKRMFNCGDDYDGTKVNVYIPYKNAFPGDYYFVEGNHEILSPNGSQADIYVTHNIWNDKVVFGNVERNYYYVDNEQQKIRYIIANSNPSDGYDKYEDAQIDWIVNVALNLDSTWTAFVFTHNIYTMLNDEFRMDPPQSPHTRAFLAALDTHNQGNQCKVAAIFQGDAHIDRILSTDGGIPIIVTNTDNYTGLQNTPRACGTITEQCFDVVIINKTTENIKMIRIGAKARDGVGPAATDQGDLVEERNIAFYGN